jgi:hypothetical protein
MTIKVVLHCRAEVAVGRYDVWQRDG